MEINIFNAIHCQLQIKLRKYTVRLYMDIAANRLLYKMDITNSDTNNFCKHCEQTVFCLFHDCNHVKRF